MAEKYIETKTSKREKKKLQELIQNGEISPTSNEGRLIERIGDDFFLKQFYINNNELDLSKVVGTLRDVDEADYTLRKLCVQLNLNDKQLGDSIKAFHKDMWGNPKYCFGSDKSKEAIQMYLETGRERVKKPYKNFCNYFGIEPDPNFPDW